MVNLGQGVAWDDYIGRGIRRNHPEDYAEYVRGIDLASFDIYPVVHFSPAVAGRLWFVPQRVRAVEQMGRPEALKAQFKARLLHADQQHGLDGAAALGICNRSVDLSQGVILHQSVERKAPLVI